MLTLGLSGGLDLTYQRREYLFPAGTCHDAAAVLAEDGRIVAAVEEERLNRIKHTSKGAVHAIRFCLASRGISLKDVDAVVYSGSEAGCAQWTQNVFYGTHNAAPVTTFRELLRDMFQDGVGQALDDGQLRFVHHHLAHAISAHLQSGQRESLVVTFDGAGDGLSGSVTHWRDGRYRVLATYTDAKSLGLLYDRVIAMLGFGFTEEYKVMGLAPYGDPQRFRPALAALYTLLPYGDYEINWHLLESLYALAPVRKKGQPILQEHMDIAAALQEAVERVVFHVLNWFRATTGLTSLCLAGGVAHNSTLNGRILYSGMFTEVFVQPASHDGGCAIGAALLPFVAPQGTEVPFTPRQFDRIEDVFWGPSIGTSAEIDASLQAWGVMLDVTRESRVAQQAAALLADGKVLGWVQGRSEFGPRALGNRSIVADPRPISHKELINSMVKKREGYRPFAPAVLEEHATDYFELPRDGASAPFMSFTLRVRPEARALLGATTHIDNSARTQTVSKRTNPAFWNLIDAFREITGVPVILNTSFNNNVEPIVDSVDDAVTTFLTTGLDALVIGDCLIQRHPDWRGRILDLSAGLPPHARLTETIALNADGNFATVHAIANTYNDESVALSARFFHALRQQRTDRSVRALLAAANGELNALQDEAWMLWEQRVIVLRPIVRARTAAAPAPQTVSRANDTCAAGSATQPAAL